MLAVQNILGVPVNNEDLLNQFIYMHDNMNLIADMFHFVLKLTVY